MLPAPARAQPVADRAASRSSGALREAAAARAFRERAAERSHSLAAHGLATLLRQAREAEVAQRAAVVELMPALTGQQRALAPAADRLGWTARGETVANEQLGDVGHAASFALAADAPSLPAPYGRCLLCTGGV